MATRMLRRGLPRVPGGEPWPPAAPSPLSEPTPSTVAEQVPSAVVEQASPPVAESAASAVAESAPSPTSGQQPQPAAVHAERGGAPATRLRRGLPRVPGGEPWPPADAAPASVAAPAAADTAPAASAAPQPASTPTADAVPVAAAAASPAVPAATGGESVRRGLPRVVGGEPWPPEGTVPATASSVPENSASPAESPASAAAATAPVAPVIEAPDTGPAPGAIVPVLADLSSPLPAPRTVWDGRAPRHITASPASGRRRPTWTQAIAVLFGAAALGVLAGAAIALVRTLLSFPFMQDFLAAFPGEYEPPFPVEPGFAPWVNWAHFFNMFLIVLIIRSGLQVRTEKRPTVFWTPRGNAKGKISLNLWFHQALDILWLVNGVVFVVLLFVTGHWARIVPTSWEVFPNALSAALQYISFDWPHENGWNNYNSLQQLAYFVTVFVAAPLAAVTGFRMSGLWPKRAEKLSKAYPVEWARALHFPIMLYFVAFIIAHVALVMLTGFLRNLNHMFAAQDAVTWTGFWVFILALVVIAGGWAAARPLVLAPIAKVFGKVSGR